MKLVFGFFHNESGATSIEYGLIAMLVSVGIIVGVTNVGTATNTMFEEIKTTVTTATN